MTRLEAQEHIRTAGFRATVQRTAFLLALSRARYPIGIAEIAVALKSERIDQVTLYRIADSFEKTGLITRVDLRAGKVLYEYAGRAHHHHITCVDCGRIEDIEACVSAATSSAFLSRSNNFKTVSAHMLEFFGTCKQCVA